MTETNNWRANAGKIALTRKAWVGYGVTIVGLLLVTAANVWWTTNPFRILAWYTMPLMSATGFALNPIAAAIAGWVGGRNGHYIVSTLVLAWIIAIVLLGTSVWAGVYYGWSGLVTMIRQVPGWYGLAYAAILTTIYTPFLYLGMRRCRRKQAQSD